MHSHHLPLLLILFLCTCVSAPCLLRAQDGVFPAFDVRSQLMGGTGLAASGLDAVWTNPAGLANADKQLSGNATVGQRFGLEELNTSMIGVAYGRGKGGFGLQLASLGYATYRENRFGLSYGRQLSDKFSIGAEFIGFSTSTEQYAGTFDLTFGLGMQLEIIPELHVGARIFSPLRVERQPDEYLPQLLALGLSYRPNKKINLNAELHQDTDHPMRIRVGAEYLPSEQIMVRLGVATNASEASFGLAYRPAGPLKRLEISAGSSWHEVLGLSPVVGVSWR